MYYDVYIGGDESASHRLYHKRIGTELIMYFYKPVISYRASNKHAAASIIPQHPPQDGRMGHTHVHTNHGDDDCCTSNYITTLGKVQLKQLNPESAVQKKNDWESVCPDLRDFGKFNPLYAGVEA